MANETTDGDLRALIKAQVPVQPGTLREITTGLDTLTDFLRQHYLEEYIPQGGSKIKFVTGRTGRGKSHFARRMLQEAEELGYLTVSFSAKKIWLHDFREVYVEIIRQCGVERVLTGCAKTVIQELGFDAAEVGDVRHFMDFLTEKGENDPLTRSEIRNALRKLFTRNAILDSCFAGCCSLLTGDILGYPVLEPSNREMIKAFLEGDKSVKSAGMRSIGLSPAPVTKYNARHLLRSLSEIIHLGGFKGLLVVIDDMETLLSRSRENPVYYTRLRRDDSYESIRQLIDDIDSMHYIMFMLCFDRELLDNDNYGIKSYQALWFRIQNEVVSARFNRFADIVDLDRYAAEYYDEKALYVMASRLTQILKNLGLDKAPVSIEQIRDILERAKYGGWGLPYMVNRTVVEGGGEHD